MSQEESRENKCQDLTGITNADQGITMPSPPLSVTTNNSTTVANTPNLTTPGINVSLTEVHAENSNNSNNKEQDEPGDNSVVVLDNSEESGDDTDDDDLAIIETREYRPTRHSIVDLDNEPEIISVNNNTTTTRTNNAVSDDDLAIIEERHIPNPIVPNNRQTIPLHLPGGNSIQINVNDYERPIISSFVNNESRRDRSRRRDRRDRPRYSNHVSLIPGTHTTFTVPQLHNDFDTRTPSRSASGSRFHEDTGETPAGSPIQSGQGFHSNNRTSVPAEVQNFIINSFTNGLNNRRRQRYQAHLNRVEQRRVRRRLNYESRSDRDYHPPPVESDSSYDSEFGPWDEMEEMFDEEEAENLYPLQPGLSLPPPFIDETRRTQNIINFIEQRENRERDIKVAKLKEKSEPLKQKYIHEAEEIEKTGEYTSKFGSFTTEENEVKDKTNDSIVPACTLCGVELGVGIPEDYHGINEEDKSIPFEKIVTKYGFHCPYQSLYKPTQLDRDLSKRSFISRLCGHLFCGRCFARIDNAKGKTKLTKKKLAELKGSSNPNNYGPRVCPAKDCKNIIRAKGRLKEVYF